MSDAGSGGLTDPRKRGSFSCLRFIERSVSSKISDGVNVEDVDAETGKAEVGRQHAVEIQTTQMRLIGTG